MKLSYKNAKEIKTTLIGLLLILFALAYGYFKEEILWTIFFGTLGVGISLVFLPDALFGGLKSLINKNKNKEL